MDILPIPPNILTATRKVLIVPNCSLQTVVREISGLDSLEQDPTEGERPVRTGLGVT
jgi:hypothetical protein